MKKLKIVGKEILKDPQNVYDIEVEDKHHYILSNGIVSHNSFFPTKVVAGGGGMKYAASIIIMLTKAQNKEKVIGEKEDQVTGVILSSNMVKSRITKEKTRVKTLLSFTKGIYPYSGLLELATDKKVWVKEGDNYKFGDKKVTKKEILTNPKVYFDKDTMDKLNVICKEMFSYGSDMGIKGWGDENDDGEIEDVDINEGNDIEEETEVSNA